MITPFRSGRQQPARSVDTVVIGAGQAGLAMSHCLAGHAIDHVVLERGDVANSWRRERWDSLRLLTPNWQNRLPGYHYRGNDPDGFMTMPEFIGFLDGYAASIAAPVQAGTTVLRVRASGSGYRVCTDRGDWQCRALVLANGAFAVPVLPALAATVPASVLSVTSQQYRNPAQLPAGRVLVVGGSATGLQLADEIRRSGREVTLSVGDHVRMPRSYRGRDIQWWMDRTGLLNQSHEDVEDLARARRLPSAQLIGSPERVTLDLNALVDQGVELVGRLVGIRDGTAQFSGSLRNCCAAADLKLNRLLDSFDAWDLTRGLATGFAAERPRPTRVPESPRLALELDRGNVGAIVWATGYRPDYSWLDLPVLDRRGQLRHQGGVVAAPGVYAMGLPFMRRRKSSFIYGAADDARDLSAHLYSWLRGDSAVTARAG
ncbi:MAG: NAD(P)-binding domain-containing protein [Haliea sp.]